MDLVLWPKIEDVILQKALSKSYTLISLGFINLKMIFILLKEIKSFHILVTIVKIGILMFKWPIKVVF